VERDGDIGIITLNRPEALNALNGELMGELADAFERFDEDAEINTVILTGAGEKAFAAGVDIKEMSGMSSVEAKALAVHAQSIFNRIEHLSKPVICAVNGYALGGGCELAMACDIRIASENAKFGQPEVSLGVTPGAGGTQRLPRLVGVGRAKELIFTGDMISAEEAYRIGLVNKVVPFDKLLAEAKQLCKKISTKGQIAVRQAKYAINHGLNAPLATGCALEIEAFSVCFDTEDQKEGMNAFMEKRKPEFKGK
jgi:enoyl-CoA hydratase